MTNINNLFFKLLRVAIGTEERLSRVPCPQEWKALYDMAKKQSLEGICFAGFQRLGADADSGFSKLGLTEMLYLTWMDMAAKIQQRNEIVNRQCVEQQERLEKADFYSFILKGQGVAMLYPEHLQGLRQSGDIDIWAMPKEAVADGRIMMTAEERRIRISECCAKLDSHYDRNKEGYLHTDLKVFTDTDVEWHFTPSFLSNPSANKRLQKWFEEQWVNRLEARG